MGSEICIRDRLQVIAAETPPLALAGGLTFKIYLLDPLRVIGDPDHLTRLFLNLLDNAIKYTPTGGQITLRTNACLLYTSDAADERSSVDLGGRRIIKKKKKKDTQEWRLLDKYQLNSQ